MIKLNLKKKKEKKKKSKGATCCSWDNPTSPVNQTVQPRKPVPKTWPLLVRETKFFWNFTFVALTTSWNQVDANNTICTVQVPKFHNRFQIRNLPPLTYRSIFLWGYAYLRHPERAGAETPISKPRRYSLPPSASARVTKRLWVLKCKYLCEDYEPNYAPNTDVNWIWRILHKASNLQWWAQLQW